MTVVALDSSATHLDGWACSPGGPAPLSPAPHGQGVLSRQADLKQMDRPVSPDLHGAPRAPTRPGGCL